MSGQREVTVKTQAELDSVVGDTTVGRIVIASPADLWIYLRSATSAHVVARGSSHVEAWESSHVEAWESSHVVAWGSSHVEAWESSHVEAWESSHVEARGSSHVEAWGSSHVEAWESSHVEARGSSHVEAWESSHVEARGSSHVVAWGSSHVVARESSHVEAWGSSHVVARESSHVEARGSSHVEARGSSHVEAWGSSHVEAWGSSHVEAWESSHVEARGSSHVEAWESSHVEASKWVAVHKHSKVCRIEGGTVIDVTSLDLENAENWCEFHGVKVENGIALVYKAVDERWTTPRGINYSPGSLPVCADWKNNNACGGGLYFSPTPAMAKVYHSAATRFVEVGIAIETLRPILDEDTPKCKAPAVVRAAVEVDQYGHVVTG